MLPHEHNHDASVLFWEHFSAGYAAPPAYLVSDTAQQLPLSDVWVTSNGLGDLGSQATLRTGSVHICLAPKKFNVSVWAGDHWDDWAMGLATHGPGVAHPLLPGLVLTCTADGAPAWIERERAAKHNTAVRAAAFREPPSGHASDAARLVVDYVGRIIYEWYTAMLCASEDVPRTPDARRMKAHAKAFLPHTAAVRARVAASALTKTLAEKDAHLREMFHHVCTLQKEVAYLRAIEAGLRAKVDVFQAGQDRAMVAAELLDADLEKANSEKEKLLQELEGWRSFGLLWYES
ncbi:hypothetical protein PsYK624_154460 [Phanerochaete sordida]|uniref:Uncharacterized protein n=1 Tax=Phanerochaete sordida TaxID=48140 RepID=A0A9P3GP92_9APHY|nr:hypothetical protein PsYK624_154460 [Phanerochaete sordida]